MFHFLFWGVPFAGRPFAVTERTRGIYTRKSDRMIYLSNTSGPQELRLMKSRAGTPARLRLRSCIDHREVDATVEVVSSGAVSDTLRVSLPETRKAWERPDGEWEYDLLDAGGDRLGTGVAVVGDYRADRQENEDNEIIYKQYGNE